MDEQPGSKLTMRRLDLVDAARGIAILAMFIYHLAWNLAYFRYLGRAIVADPLWRGFAISIAASFLFLVGVSLVLSTFRGINWRRFFIRLGWLIGAAGLVSAVTYLLFPSSFIFFGILHSIAVCSLLGLCFLRLPLSLVAITALAVFLAPHFLADPFFNSWPWRWLGLMTYFPQTNDYEPILPWFAATLTGILVARAVINAGLLPRLARRQATSTPERLLCFGGRNSLVIYLVHQPVFFGLVWAAAMIAPAPGFGPLTVERYEGICRANCIDGGLDGAGFCTPLCACMERALTDSNLLLPLVENRLSTEQSGDIGDMAVTCEQQARSEAKTPQGKTPEIETPQAKTPEAKTKVPLR